MNVVIITGNLGKDPERKSESLVTFSIAVNEYYSGEKHTMWVDCASFGKTADLAEKYLKKGSQVGIVGALSVKVVDTDKGKRTYYGVRVRTLEFIGKRKEPDKAFDKNDNGDDVPF